jgi:ribosomal protein S18 acetylase RimI-like enzyme
MIIMATDLIDIRQAKKKDADALAAVREEAWRATYQGLIPHATLQQMIAAHGPSWWSNLISIGSSVLLLDFDGKTQGYVSYGRARRGPAGIRGEIYELYLTPTYQGAGLGKRLFETACAELRRRRLNGLVVWTLSDNVYACEFYEALGGKLSARGIERFGKTKLERLAYVWR